MAGGYRVLELNLISANDLKKVTLLSRMRVYAVASIFGGDPRLPVHSTSADRHGGCCPAWNSVFHFPIPSGADTRGLVLRVLLRTERVLGARDVGEVFVPVDDLMAGADRASRPATYQVRRPRSGRPHGMLYLCYKFIDIPTTGANKYGQGSPEKAAHKVVTEDASPATAYPPPAQTAHPYGSAYSPPQAWFPYNAVPQYSYAPPPPAANQHGGRGMGIGLGLGLLGGAVGGRMVGDVVADAAYDTAFSNGLLL